MRTSAAVADYVKRDMGLAQYHKRICSLLTALYKQFY